MRSSQSSEKRSRALLPSLPPTFSSPALLSTSFLRRRRHLQLRGPVLLISKAPLTSDPSPADLALLLVSAHPPRAVGPAAVVVHPSYKLAFPSPAVRDRFLQAATAALAKSAAREGGYRFLARLGNGASGTAYAVRRVADAALLAVKAVPKTDVFLSASALAHLVAERTALAEAAARRAPFHVRLVDAFETAHHLCFVTELASFGDLRALQRRFEGERFPERVARALFSEIVLALEDAHRIGFLYRDMKPANLLLTGSGHVRLADFGLAKRMEVEVEASSVSSLSGEEEAETEEAFRLVGRTQSFVGTKRFMSPEHIPGGFSKRSGYGAPSDIWALGVTLYVLMTGVYPYGRTVSMNNPSAMFFAVQSEEISYPDWLSKGAKGMLEGLLERNSLERFNFAEIKSHIWMKGVDWGRLRADAIADVPVEEVLGALRERGVNSFEEGEEQHQGKIGGDSHSLSSLTGATGSVGNKAKTGMEDYGLLGFEYLDL